MPQGTTRITSLTIAAARTPPSVPASGYFPSAGSRESRVRSRRPAPVIRTILTPDACRCALGLSLHCAHLARCPPLKLLARCPQEGCAEVELLVDLRRVDLAHRGFDRGVRQDVADDRVRITHRAEARERAASLPDVAEGAVSQDSSCLFQYEWIKAWPERSEEQVERMTFVPPAPTGSAGHRQARAAIARHSLRALSS